MTRRSARYVMMISLAAVLWGQCAIALAAIPTQGIWQHYSDQRPPAAIQYVTDRIWYGAGDGRVHRSDDAGVTWRVLLSAPGYSAPNAIHAFDEDRVLAVGNGGNLWESVDGGVSWTSRRIADIAVNFTDISFSSPLTGVAYGTYIETDCGEFACKVGVWVTTLDGGVTWNKTNAARATEPTWDGWTTVWAPARREGWQTNGVSLFHTCDGGTVWIEQQTERTRNENMLGLRWRPEGVFVWLYSGLDQTGRGRISPNFGQRGHINAVEGPTRFDVAAQGARASYDSSGTRTWDGVTDVVIASGDDRAAADPLSAASIAWAYDAPLLLVSSRKLPSATAQVVAEIAKANGSVTAHVVGGVNSVPPEIMKSLAQAAGGRLEEDRILALGGRYDLAARVADRVRVVREQRGMSDADAVLIANGADSTKFFDAVSLSAIARHNGFPILLVTRDSVPAATEKALTRVDCSDIIVAGGTQSVSADVVRRLGALSDLTPTVLAGRSRYDTSLDVAEEGLGRGWLTTGTAGVAVALPDALAGGAVVGRAGGPLLVTAGPFWNPLTANWVRDHRDGLPIVHTFGGPTNIGHGTRYDIIDRIN